ncbi:MAG: hypothetical protein R2774_14100 [Saprospiraceae bacterium]
MKYFIILVISLVTNVAISAQAGNPKQKQSPTELAQEYTDGLTKALKLTPTQSKELYKSSLKYEKDTEVVQKSALTNAQKYDKLVIIRAARSSALKRILTKEQYKKYTLSFP